MSESKSINQIMKEPGFRININNNKFNILDTSSYPVGGINLAPSAFKDEKDALHPGWGAFDLSDPI